jgi:secondary thiamine-phosphate synthase enzyme
MATITLNTSAREQLIDITAQVARAVERFGISDGICYLHCLHTTAALTINENADPDVKRDLLMALGRIVADNWPYTHAEGNSPAHVKSSLLGCQLTLPVQGGRLALGRWQGVLFAEFDGPRQGRQVQLTMVAAAG